MKRGLTMMLLSLSACSRVGNSFVVEDGLRLVEEATLELCGSEVLLIRAGDHLAVSKTITCEGSGRIALRYSSGAEHYCPVGYVTPGAVQTFRYTAMENGCA
jgi:hypothetical protein